jgi:hypothetical protein
MPIIQGCVGCACKDDRISTERVATIAPDFPLNLWTACGVETNTWVPSSENVGAQKGSTLEGSAVAATTSNDCVETNNDPGLRAVVDRNRQQRLERMNRHPPDGVRTHEFAHERP